MKCKINYYLHIVIQIIILSYTSTEAFAQELFPLKVKGKWGLYNELGEKKVALKDYESVGEFKEGMAMVTLIEPGKNDYFSHSLEEIKNPVKYGFINEKGEEIVPTIYDGMNDFSQGLARAYVDEGKDYYEKSYYFINKSGTKINEYGFNYVGTFSEGMAAYCNNDNCGYMNLDLKITTGLPFNSAQDFNEGLAVVAFINKFGYIDTSGTFIISNKYSEAENFSEGFAAVKLNNKWGYIAKTGRSITAFKYDYVSSFSEGRAAVGKDNKFTFIDSTGKEFSALMYDEVHTFSSGVATVKIGGYWGFIDKNNKTIVAPKYAYVRNYFNGFAMVSLPSIAENDNITWCYIDKKGKEITENKYSEYSQGFYNGNAIVRLSSSGYGVIDITGKEIISATEENEQIILKNGFFIVVKKDGTILRLDKKGNLAK